MNSSHKGNIIKEVHRIELLTEIIEATVIDTPLKNKICDLLEDRIKFLESVLKNMP